MRLHISVSTPAGQFDNECFDRRWALCSVASIFRRLRIIEVSPSAVDTAVANCGGISTRAIAFTPRPFHPYLLGVVTVRVCPYPSTALRHLSKSRFPPFYNSIEPVASVKTVVDLLNRTVGNRSDVEVLADACRLDG